MCLMWSKCRDSNPGPQHPKCRVLPTELHLDKKTIESSLLNAETLSELVCIAAPATPHYYFYCFRLSKTPNSSL